MIIESLIPKELDGQKQIVIGSKGNREKFTDWIKVAISINRQVQLIGIDLPKMISICLILKNQGFCLGEPETKGGKIYCMLPLNFQAFMTPSQVTIIDSGPISSNLPTGTAITSFQKAAILINVPQEQRESTFYSASIVLDCSLCTNSSTITLSLCSNFEDDDCLEKGTFNLSHSLKKISAEWQSRKFPVLKNRIYWLKVEGNKNSFEQSFSWLDAANFKATEAFTNENGTWTVLPDVIGASTLVFVVQ